MYLIYFRNTLTKLNFLLKDKSNLPIDFNEREFAPDIFITV